MRSFLSVLLSLSCAFDLCARTADQPKPSMAETLRALPLNTPVEVRLRDGTRLRGWLREVGDQNFALDHEVRHQLERSEFPLDSLQNVKAIKNVHQSHTTRNILIGVAIPIVVLGVCFGIWFARGGPVY